MKDKYYNIGVNLSAILNDNGQLFVKRFTDMYGENYELIECKDFKKEGKYWVLAFKEKDKNGSGGYYFTSGMLEKEEPEALRYLYYIINIMIKDGLDLSNIEWNLEISKDELGFWDNWDDDGKYKYSHNFDINGEHIYFRECDFRKKGNRQIFNYFDTEQLIDDDVIDDMSENEKFAYNIVQKYGYLSSVYTQIQNAQKGK